MKEDIKEILISFLEQAETNNLKTSHFPSYYLGLSLKVSFGQGTRANIPWISFLGKDQKTSEGIYPVYLLFKEYQKLILAYGISELNKPKINWSIRNGDEIKTVQKYFETINIKPDRYGTSYVFAVYDLKIELNWNKIENDLNDLIKIYYETIEEYNINPKMGESFQKDNLQEKLNKEVEVKSTKMFKLEKIKTDLISSGLHLNEKLITRFICSLLTKPFVILTGLSGSGKTKLAQAFALWICENENQYCILSVGADWTNRDPLIGFPNALKNEEYVKPENRVLDLLIMAVSNPQKPYFLILDEMNLSHVERYFADFLSVMESKEKISLHAGNVNWGDVPPEINLPENLFIVGTVNIDETTYMFSPKVLDRANVIEFRVTVEELNNYFNNNSGLDFGNLKFKGANMAENFVDIATDKTIKAIEISDLQLVLLDFFRELKKTGAEFGYRSAAEIIRFAAIVNKIEQHWSLSEIMDAAIMQKLLPKVHGSRRKLEPVLKTLGNLCLQKGQFIDEFISSKTEIDFGDYNKIKYPLSLEKILRMYNGLIDNGFTSYAEA